MRTPKAIWCLLALLSLVPAHAAIQFDVLPGYETYVHGASWFPVMCEVFNDGPSFNAIIEVSGGGQFSSEQVRQVPVELPTNTRKRIFIPMFAPASYPGQSENWTGKLLDSNGKPIRGIDPRVANTKVIGIDSVIMGALPRNFGGSPVFPDLKNNVRNDKPEAARITIDQFPDNPITLDGLNSFYLSSEKAPDLKVNQITALLAWVRAGGHLIVSTEQIADLNGTPWLKQFAPMELADARNLKIDQDVIGWVQGQSYTDAAQAGRRNRRIVQFNGSTSGYDLPVDASFDNAEMAVATGKVKDGSILFSSEAVPLAVQAPRGRGKITLLTFSPEREPFRTWKGRGFFWAKLAGIPPDYFRNQNPNWGGTSVDSIFGALIDSRQIKKLPVTWLLLLLVVYLVVIGPFDQWWLKKINKQMLTWITFPSYVVLFSLLIYFIGYKLRAGETEWNELNIVDVLPRGDKVDLRGETYVSIYSSGNATYPISGQQGHAALRPEAADMHNGGGRNDRLKIVQHGNTYKAEVFVPVWTSLLYTSEWYKTNDTPFLASVTRSGNGFQLEIENYLNRPLSELRVVAGQSIFEVGDIAANAKKVIPLEPTKGANVRQFVRENGTYYQRAVETRRQVLGDTSGGRLENRPVTTVTVSLLSYLEDQQPGRNFISPPGLDIVPQVERGDAVIFAWLPNFSLAEKMNNFSPPRFKQDTMLRLTVPIH
jgi:hypothetical protein